jgi:hypothetical protein
VVYALIKTFSQPAGMLPYQGFAMLTLMFIAAGDR